MSKFETVKVNVKTHVQKHKKAYVVAGAVVGVGTIAAGAYILGTRTVPKEVETLVAPKNVIKGVAWKPVQTIEVTIEALGDPGNIIQDLTTGTIYASQNQAAKALGVHPARIAEHLAGKLPHVQNHQLTKLGKAVVPALAE